MGPMQFKQHGYGLVCVYGEVFRGTSGFTTERVIGNYRFDKEF